MSLAVLSRRRSVLADIAAWLEHDGSTKWIVGAIFAYVGALFVLRLGVSPFLDIDEAQFVGNVDLRMVYGNSHPPLYNWLVRAALELTGWRWALAVTIVRALCLLATFGFLFDAGRRLAGPTGGAIALAAAALCPQVSWMSAHTFAHSLLVMAGAAGVLHGLVLALRDDRAVGWVTAGACAGIALLAKYNIGLLLVPLAIALAIEAPVREMVRRQRGAAVLGGLVFAALALVALLGVAEEPAAATERMSKLYRDGPFAALDLPGVGVDGAFSLALSVLASGGIVLVAALAARRQAPPVDALFARILWRTLAIGLGGFLVFVLVADISLVHERYLTPLTMVLPLFAAVTLPAVSWRGAIVGAGALAAIAVVIGVVGMVTFTKHRFARPYEALAMPLAATAPEGTLEVRSKKPDLAANMTLALRRLGRDAHVSGDPLAVNAPSSVINVEPRGWTLAPFDRETFCASPPYEIEAPYDNLAGKTLAISAVIFAPPYCTPPAG